MKLFVEFCVISPTFSHSYRILSHTRPPAEALDLAAATQGHRVVGKCNDLQVSSKCHSQSTKRGSLAFKPSFWPGPIGRARTRYKRVRADLRVESLSTVPPTSPLLKVTKGIMILYLRQAKHVE
ncbi:hypothetical protein PoB_007629800 [Plakobranchus ocellatus]|uniref:Uncharacterized protein n=1 Tax=Plakobranchus ocellatus TaxID=259542 RepID=A0AAV4E098_9GAST|nr:hypothetical protein PoB_007629800 [Plakobranchus ocellatus]